MKKFVSVILILTTIISLISISFITASAASDGLPDVVDNSTSKYFPPILSQGDQGSCVAWAQAYYQFTYEMNKTLDRESTKENCFSPSFVYNMSNYGEDTGCFPNTAYGNMKKIGVTPWSTIPYNKEEHRNWFAEESIWQEAAKYRVDEVKVLPNFRTGSGKHVTEPDDADLTQIKTLLSEGHILTFGAYIYRWKLSTIKSNPSAPANDPYVGEEVIAATSPDIGTGFGHRMTLVGYNDNIWVDINNNKTIDQGEMGAFKVANSFGTWWKNDGFIWMAYDNINMTTSVAGGLPYNTMSGLVDVTKITVLPYNSDADMYLRYTLNTKDRQNLTVTITAEKNGEKFSAIAGPHHDAPYAKNIYSFDGTTSSNDGTMIFALSNVVPGITSQTINDYKWSITIEDTKADSVPLTVKNAEIVDISTDRISKPSDAFGFKLDGTSKTLTFPKLSENFRILYYKGLSAPIISYTDSKETLITELMPADSSEKGYTHKYVFKNGIAKNSTISFSDNTGLIDNNGGKGYALENNVNFCKSEYTTTTKTIGDTDQSGTISIKDSTYLRKFLAHLISEEKIDTKVCDTDADKNISVKDATEIQKYIADLNAAKNIGNPVVSASFNTKITADNTEIIQPPIEPEIPTEKPTDPPVSQNKVTFTNALNWSGTISCYYWSDSNTNMITWPGKAMEKSGTNEFGQAVYTFTVPSGATKLIFTNGSNQTVDINYSGGEVNFYTLNTTNGNKYNVSTW